MFLASANVKFFSTQWKTFAKMSISFQCQLDNILENKLLARWRVRTSQYKGTPAFTLVLEVMALPLAEDPIGAMQVKTREAAEGPGAPVFIVYKSNPINWLPPTSFPLIQPHGMMMIPWLTIYKDPLDHDDLLYPSDACIRR